MTFSGAANNSYALVHRVGLRLLVHWFLGNHWRLQMKSTVLVLGLLLMAIPVFAHHGGTSLYDMSKEVTTEATVTEFLWTNPHVEIGLNAKGDRGKVRHWILETNSTPVMVNRGWNRKILRPGDVIKVTFNPSQRGGSVGRLIKLNKADGTELR
jgi:hypothetical protein